MISLPWIVWGGVRIFAPDLFEEQSDLSKEKRNKNELDFKELLNSGEGLSLYIDDRVPFRGGLIKIYQEAESNTEKVYTDVMRKVVSVVTGKGTGQKEVVSLGDLIEDSSASDTEDFPDEDHEKISEGLNHEHKLAVADIVEPTCDSAGYIVYKCEECDHTEKTTTKPLGHDYMLIKESAASYETYGYKEYQCKRCGKLDLRDLEAKYVDTTYFAPQTVGNGTMVGRFNWMFYEVGKCLEYFTGANTLSAQELDKYASKVNRLKALCDERGITPVIMFMPNKEQVYPEYMPTLEIVNEYKRTKELTDYLTENTDVVCLYPLEELKAAEVFWPVYYRYDSHWNHMGAFVGAQAFYKALGMATTNPMFTNAPATEVTRKVLIALGGLSEESYPADIEYVPSYRENVTVEGFNPYADVCHTFSSSDNACKLVMLSDSYREMMSPYLVKDFSECVIAHRLYMDQVTEDIKNCNILFITAVERDDVSVMECIDKVISILETQ